MAKSGGRIGSGRRGGAKGSSGGHGPSIKNPATYSALKRVGMDKSSAAAISNAALNKGHKMGEHGGR